MPASPGYKGLSQHWDWGTLPKQREATLKSPEGKAGNTQVRQHRPDPELQGDLCQELTAFPPERGTSTERAGEAGGGPGAAAHAQSPDVLLLRDGADPSQERAYSSLWKRLALDDCAQPQAMSVPSSCPRKGGEATLFCSVGQV